MEKKLIEYLKKWLKGKTANNSDPVYAQCCRDIEQIIDVAESMYVDDPPKRRRRRTKKEMAETQQEPPKNDPPKTTPSKTKNTDKPWQCKNGHFFDFPKNGKACPDPNCLTRTIEKNPDFVAPV